ncbi:hypothetical protein, partial [Salmonella enterica]|uniref:hypothetical protein n=1 Tax=Salmonella enterica TaxID=28901 RepID=UPI003299A045
VLNLKVDNNAVMSSLDAIRFILEPSDGDMSAKFLGTSGAINKPNLKNEGAFTVNIAEGTMTISMPSHGNAGTVIISRYEN